jgi:hypothetical protein
MKEGRHGGREEGRRERESPRAREKVTNPY